MSLQSTPLKWRIVGAFIIICGVWGSSYLGIKFALETIPPFLLSSVRFMFAGLVMILLARRQGVPLPTRVQWRKAFFTGFFMFALANSMLVWAQKFMPSGLAATLYATVPLWFALLGWLWLGQDRPGWRVIAGLIMGLVGVVLLIQPGESAGNAQPMGVLMIMIGAFSWTFGSLLSRKSPTSRSPVLSSGMYTLAGGFIMLVMSIVTGEWSSFDLAAVSMKSFLSMLHLIFSSSIIAFLAYMWLLTVTTPNRVATYAFINPVIAVFLGWLLGGEQLTVQELIAAVVILMAVILIVTAQARAVRLPQPVVTPAPVRARLRTMANWGGR